MAAELSSDYVMHFTKSSTTDYVIVKELAKDLSQVDWKRTEEIEPTENR